MNQALTESPVALAGVSADTDYTFQNKSDRPMWMLDDAAAAPSDASDTGNAFLIQPWQTGTFKVGSGNSAYAWLAAHGVGTGLIVYSESA